MLPLCCPYAAPMLPLCCPAWCPAWCPPLPPRLAPQVKIADFGASTVVKVPRIENETSQELPAFKLAASLRGSVGTPCNMAPEVFNHNYGPMADMWSLGCVVYELLTGTPTPLLTLAHPCSPLLTLAHPCSPLVSCGVRATRRRVVGVWHPPRPHLAPCTRLARTPKPRRQEDVTARCGRRASVRPVQASGG